MSNYRESEITPEVLAALTRRPGLAIDDIIQEVWTAMGPDGVDASPYPSRPDGEPRFFCKSYLFSASKKSLRLKKECAEKSRKVIHVFFSR